MKTLNKLLITALAAIFIVSCDDILEEDITNDNIIIISPLNNAQIESNVVNFRWNEVDGADEYRIQLFSSSSQNMMLDSLVNGSSFTYPINPGGYQWRIRGENFAYETAYTFPAGFTITTSDDLTNQQVILSSPDNNIYTSNVNLNFSWLAISNADSYSFELLNVTNGNTSIINETNLTSPNYTLGSSVITQDAKYSWRVNAKNSLNGTATPYASRSFFVDRAAPNTSQNTLPLNDAQSPVNQLLTFEWTIPNDSGGIQSPLLYTIEIATNTTFTNIIESETVTNNSYQYTFTTAGNYYWRVRTKDQAGNQSGYSAYFKIVIQ